MVGSSARIVDPRKRSAAGHKPRCDLSCRVATMPYPAYKIYKTGARQGACWPPAFLVTFPAFNPLPNN